MRRNPGVIADCTGDNAGDSVGPSADGFETYGVTGVALISFILLAVADATVQVQLLVWIFVMRVMMIIASGVSYLINEAWAKASYGTADKMNFESPLTRLVWLTSFVSVALTYVVSYWLIPNIGGNADLWWQLSTVITCGTLAGAIIPELVKIFTSTESSHVREVVTSSREGGASLNILSGFVAGNFSAYWLGMSILGLMAVAYGVSTLELQASRIMIAPAVFAFGLVAFGFLGMGPVTIAVDSYGPVTDNAQSVYELSVIESLPNIKQELKKDYGIDVNFERAKHLLEENDGAGNTFKATAKPVLIGTAVVGATTMIFSIIVVLTHGLTSNLEKLSILHPPFLLGLMAGGCMIYWFTGASTQAVTTGAYRAVEFIKANIRLDTRRQGVGGGQQEGRRDLHSVRAEGDVQYFPRGLLRHARVCFPRAVFLHRLPGLDRALRSLPGDLHGECRRCVGQRQENRRGRAEGKGDSAPCGDGRRRHGRRPVQGHLIGRDEPRHQIYNPVWSTGGRTRRPACWAIRVEREPLAVWPVSCGFGVLRLALFLRHADRPAARVGLFQTSGFVPISRAISRETVSKRVMDRSLTLVFASAYNSRSCAAPLRG